MQKSKLWMAAGLTSLCLSLTLATPLAGGSAKYTGAKVEEIAGSHLKRITLSDIAIQRLAIESAKVREMPMPERQTVEAEIIELPEAFADANNTRAPLGVKVAIEPTQDVEALLKDRWVRLNYQGRGYSAKWVGSDELGTSRRQANALYFTFNGSYRDLRRGDVVEAQLDLPGRGNGHKVVPYAAIIYDTDGTVWVYTQSQKNVFERKPVVVDKILNGMAYLKSGPPMGTEVVTVGVIELYGVETGIGK